MAVPVRPADPAIVDLLGPGMHVAVILVGESGEPAVLAADAVVLVGTASDPIGVPRERPIVLAVPAESADQHRRRCAGRDTIALRFT